MLLIIQIRFCHPSKHSSKDGWEREGVEPIKQQHQGRAGREGTQTAINDTNTREEGKEHRQQSTIQTRGKENTREGREGTQATTQPQEQQTEADKTAH